MARILLIDDDELSRMVLKEHLIQVGHSVIEAEDGKSGLEIYYKEKIDLVITDIFMPYKDGLSIITELTSDFPEIKIFAISDGGKVVKSLEYLEHARDFGAIRVFRKSKDIDKLISTIPEVLRAN
ncbi:response regulator [bacterium]|nr:response regulator [bacterium]